MPMPILFRKTYNSPAEIIELLEQRGLIFDNKSASELMLMHNGYYRFSAYLYPFLAIPKENQIFKPDSKFSSAMALYEFDKKLRLLIFRYIADVEVAIRSAIANIAAKETGNMFWMTDPTLFANAEKQRKTSAIIDKELDTSREEFIEHFKRKYSNPYPPAWMLAEILPMGVLNRMYGNLVSNALRKKIASHFSLSAPVFGSWFTVVVLTRNACCHHARVWNKENAIVPVVPRRMQLPWLTSSVARNRIFYDLCIIKFFVNQICQNNKMKEDLANLLAEYPIIDTRAMGFPDNWENEPVWL